VLKDTVKKTKVVVLFKKLKDTVADKMGELVLHKRDAHASLCGQVSWKRTASGVPFDRINTPQLIKNFLWN
jgi:rare lipoprotein A